MSGLWSVEDLLERWSLRWKPLGMSQNRASALPDRRRWAGLILLIALGDVLFWEQELGASLVVFGLSFFSVSANCAPSGRILPAGALIIICCLPVLEYLQPLSMAIFVCGLSVSLIWLHMHAEKFELKTLYRAVALFLSIPWAGVRDLARRTRVLTWTGRGTVALEARNWAFPIGGTLIIAALLTEANPVFENWLESLLDIELDWWRAAARSLLWIGIGLVVWPLLLPQSVEVVSPRMRSLPLTSEGVGLNPDSVARALILFNAILGLQTVTDGVVLWGERGLPEGMTYAEYAHRGSYPLLATAVLAGGFSLMARPFLREGRWFKPLLYLWLAQNIVLSSSALYRLVLYVDAYGLTYLRVYVFIWIPLVGAGLALIGWQIWKDRSGVWLVVRCAATGFVVLYISAFVNFAALIAKHNLERTTELDSAYLCKLPDTAAAAIMNSRNRRLLPCDIRFEEIEGWRDWGFRRWVVSRNIPMPTDGGPSHEDPSR